MNAVLRDAGWELELLRKLGGVSYGSDDEVAAGEDSMDQGETKA